MQQEPAAVKSPTRHLLEDASALTGFFTTTVRYFYKLPVWINFKDGNSLLNKDYLYMA